MILAPEEECYAPLQRFRQEHIRTYCWKVSVSTMTQPWRKLHIKSSDCLVDPQTLLVLIVQLTLRPSRLSKAKNALANLLDNAYGITA